MSTGSTGAIGPVSVRYAAQIRNLLYTQALQRMAADQEAARTRTEAERSARTEPTDKAAAPLYARVDKVAKDEVTTPAAADTTTVTQDKPTTAQLVDIQA